MPGGLFIVPLAVVRDARGLLLTCHYLCLLRSLYGPRPATDNKYPEDTRRWNTSYGRSNDWLTQDRSDRSRDNRDKGYDRPDDETLL